MLATFSKTIEPHQNTACGQDELGHNPSSSGIPEYLRLSPRVTLVTGETVRAARGVNAEDLAAMVDDAMHPMHLRFSFNVSIGWRVRELRYWRVELTAPAMVRNFTIQDAIARILGGARAIRRSELQISWQISSNLVTHLIRANFLKCEHGRFLRPVLEAFLLSRWTGANPT
ncbi:MAG TPA: hypothetical protein VH280_17820 [Verrucomicrobiae bacterium]|jgi:hypothetical protein|nr:hypothetical protein [Verrucomicrobiae bacterium]